METDVIVVGAGLAGLVAARDLARAGHGVVVVDVKSAAGRPVHTTGIFVRRTLSDFEIPERFLGAPIRRVSLESPSGCELVLESGRDEFRVGRMEAMYGWLLSEAVAAGAQWMPGVRYRSSAVVEGGSAVWLERGGRRWRVRTRLLVGADGADSRVAADLGLDRNREWIVGVEEVLEGTVMPDAPSFRCLLDPAIAPGYIGWVVDDGEHVHVGAGGHADGFSPGASLAAMRARLERRVGSRALAGLRRVERRGGRIPVNGILARIGCERGVLVGDATGAVSPLTAGGLDPCFRLTGLAVRLAGLCLERGRPEILESYSGEAFRRHFRKRLLLRRVLAAVRSRAAAESVCAVLRCRPLRLIAEGLFFGRGSFPDVTLDLRDEAGDGFAGGSVPGRAATGRTGRALPPAVRRG